MPNGPAQTIKCRKCVLRPAEHFKHKLVGKEASHQEKLQGVESAKALSGGKCSFIRSLSEQHDPTGASVPSLVPVPSPELSSQASILLGVTKFYKRGKIRKILFLIHPS